MEGERELGSERRERNREGKRRSSDRSVKYLVGTFRNETANKPTNPVPMRSVSMNSRIRSAVYLLVPAEFSFSTIMSKEEWRYRRHVRYLALQKRAVLFKINGMVTHRPKTCKKESRLQNAQNLPSIVPCKCTINITFPQEIFWRHKESRPKRHFFSQSPFYKTQNIYPAIVT